MVFVVFFDSYSLVIFFFHFFYGVLAGIFPAFLFSWMRRLGALFDA